MSDRKTLTAEIESRNEAIAAEIEQESIILANLGQSVHGSGLVEGNTVDKVIEERLDLGDKFHVGGGERLLEFYPDTSINNCRARP